MKPNEHHETQITSNNTLFNNWTFTTKTQHFEKGGISVWIPSPLWARCRRESSQGIPGDWRRFTKISCLSWRTTWCCHDAVMLQDWRSQCYAMCHSDVAWRSLQVKLRMNFQSPNVLCTFSPIEEYDGRRQNERHNGSNLSTGSHTRVVGLLWLISLIHIDSVILQHKIRSMVTMVQTLPVGNNRIFVLLHSRMFQDLPSRGMCKTSYAGLHF